MCRFNVYLLPLPIITLFIGINISFIVLAIVPNRKIPKRQTATILMSSKHEYLKKKTYLLASVFHNR